MQNLIKDTRNMITKAQERACCSVCKMSVRVKEFRDELSLKEYGISGLCQDCQDDFFADDQDV